MLLNVVGCGSFVLHCFDLLYFVFACLLGDFCKCFTGRNNAWLDGANDTVSFMAR